MIPNLLFSLGWLWNDMTKTPSHDALTTAFALIVLLYVLSNNDEYTSSATSVFLNGFILIAIGCCEVYGHVAHYGDPTWILDSFGNFFFGMCVLFVAFLMMISQYYLTRGVLNGLSYAGDFENKYGSGFTSVVVAAVAAIIASIFGGEAAMIVGILFLVFQLYIVGLTIYSAITNNGNVLYALFSIIIYLAGVVGLVFLFIHFLLPAIFAAILMAIGNAKNTCSNCRSYNNGYCYYKNKSVSGGSEACGKFEYPR
jgi:hypothetical protein